MSKKKCISLMICFLLLFSCFTQPLVFAEEQNNYKTDIVSTNDKMNSDLPDKPRKNTRAQLFSAGQETELTFNKGQKKAVFKAASGGDLDHYMYRNEGTIDFTIDLKGFGVDTSRTTSVSMRVWDVDQNGSEGHKPEVDKVYLNGSYIGTLTGANGSWSDVSFKIPKGTLKSGVNNFRIDIDENNEGWAVEVDYAKIEIPFNVAQIEAKANDSVQIKRGTTDDIIKNPIWKTAFDSSGSININPSVQDSIADKINGGNGTFEYGYKLGCWPINVSQSWKPTVKYKYEFWDKDWKTVSNSGNFKQVEGFENSFPVKIPDKVGKYRLCVTLEIYAGSTKLCEEKCIHTVYALLNDPVECEIFDSFQICVDTSMIKSEKDIEDGNLSPVCLVDTKKVRIPKTAWLDVATDWGAGSNDITGILKNINENEYKNLLGWKYGYIDKDFTVNDFSYKGKTYKVNGTVSSSDKANAITLIENGRGKFADCYVFRDVWRMLAASLGISTWNENYNSGACFITSTREALDKNDSANLFKKGSSTPDRWIFSSHALGRNYERSNITNYYDPTFGLNYTDPKSNIYAERNGYDKSGNEKYKTKSGDAVSVTERKINGVQEFKNGWGHFEYEVKEAKKTRSSVSSLMSVDSAVNATAEILSHSEKAIDDDGNGFYEYLAADFEINAKEAGTYALRSSIETSIGDFIAAGSLSRDTGIPMSFKNDDTIELKKGKQTVRVYFKGKSIKDFGVSGIYKINAYLCDSSDSLQSSAEFMTNNYSVDKFQGILIEKTTVSDKGIDVNGDSLFDTLDFNVGINVLADGNYTVEGILLSENSNIGSVKVERKFTKGVQSVTLNFIGKDIRFNQADGPYKLFIILNDGQYTGEFEYDTKAYKYGEFQMPDAFFTGSTSDSAKDTNGNGLYEELSIKTKAAAEVPGDYTIYGTLKDKDGNFIETLEQKVSLNDTPIDVTFTYQGRFIHSAGVDGPYKVEMIISDGNDKDLAGIRYDTGNYKCTDFEAPSASFAGNYTESIVDTNGDKLSDILRIGFDINTMEAGNYKIEGALFDKNAGYITSYTRELNLGTGKSTVSLDFSGSEINDHGINGPYDLCTLKITKSDKGEVCSILKAYTTQSYDYNTFQSSKLSLTGNNSDVGEDADNDKLYDYLAVTLEVIVPAAGYYNYNARLVDKNDEEILWVSDAKQFQAGKQQIVLKFDGRYIYGNKEDGQYQVKDLSIYMGEQVFSIIDTYTTKEYKWDEFEHTSVVFGKAGTGYMPIENVNIFINGVNSDITNSKGEYRLKVMGSGKYVIQVLSDEKYYPWEVLVNGEKVGTGDKATINVPQGEELQVDFITKIELPPILEPVENKTINENEALQFTANCLEPNGQTVTYAVYNAPKGAGINSRTGEFSWKPDYSQAGIYKDIELAVSDGKSTVTDLFDINVINVNHAPTLSPISDITVKTNEQVKIKLEASDPEGDSVTYAVYNAPAGAVLDPASNIFTWVPDSTKAGVYSGIKFVASDGVLTDSKTITITVTAPSTTYNSNSGSSGSASTPTPTPTVKVTGEPTKPVPQALQHNAYITGYPDGLFKPENPVTRAEAAVILANLLGNDKTGAAGSVFDDVKDNHWAAAAIAFAVEQGLFKGYPGKLFKPDQYITRAEFAAIIFRLSGGEYSGDIDLKFKDIKGHWAQRDIDFMAGKGYIKGYSDETFRPDSQIKRSECIAIINRYESRGPLLGAPKTFPDVDENYWAFNDIAEASINHSYTINDKNQEVFDKEMAPSNKLTVPVPSETKTPIGKILGITDQSSYDFNADGRVEYLKIVAKVNVEEDGEYSIKSDLSTSEGELISIGNVQAGVGIVYATTFENIKLKKGENMVPLYFSGSRISEVKKDGPYKLNIYLQSLSNLIDSFKTTTKAFLYKEFYVK